MTQEPITPVVRLQFSGGLSAEEGRRLAAITSATRDPAEVFRHVLMAFRVFTIRDVKERLARNEIELTTQGVAGALDAAWVLFSPQMTPLASPMVGQAYLSAVRAVNGDIPPDVIAELSREHVLRVGRYFHESSREALVSGFNIYVNRRIPPRVALERALRGYGLTMRQMVGMTSIKDDLKVESMQPMNLEAKIQAYIGRALHQRFHIFAHQEAHNLTNQANQVAWLWLVEHGQMNPETEKIWITAKDEKVCAICGPLHGKVVPITEQFPVEGGSLWVPGAHTNCRCWVRIRTPLGNLSIAKSMYGISYPEVTHEWVETEHPRGEGGRWTDKPHHHTKPRVMTRSVDEEFMSLVSQIKSPPPLAGRTSVDAAYGDVQSKTELTPAILTSASLDLPDFGPAATPKVFEITAVPDVDLVGLPEVEGVTIGDLEKANPRVDLDEVGKRLAKTDSTPDHDHMYAVLKGPMPTFSQGDKWLHSRIAPTRFFYGPDAARKANEAAELRFEQNVQNAVEAAESNADSSTPNGVYFFETNDGRRLGLGEDDLDSIARQIGRQNTDEDAYIHFGDQRMHIEEVADVVGFSPEDFEVNILKLEVPEEIKRIQQWRGTLQPGGGQALNREQMRVKGYKVGGPIDIVDDSAWRDPQETDDAHPYVRTITIRPSKAE